MRFQGVRRADNGCRKPPTAEDISVAQEGLERVRSDLAARRRSIERLQAAQPKAEGSWFSRVVPSFSGGSGKLGFERQHTRPSLTECVLQR